MWGYVGIHRCANPHSKTTCEYCLLLKTILRIKRYWLASEPPCYHPYGVCVIDLLSRLSTVAGLTALYRTGRTCFSQIVSHRLSPALALSCFVCLVTLQRCAGLALGKLAQRR